MFPLSVPILSRGVAFSIIVLSSTIAVAQSDTRDSLYNPLRKDIHTTSINLRVGMGIHHRYNLEIGFSRNTFLAGPHGMFGSSLYGSFVVFPAFRRESNTVTGFKAGAEVCGSAMLLGLEWSSYWGDGHKDGFIAPKIGLGIPDVSVWYAYNFSVTDSNYSQLGRHSVGIQVSPHLWSRDKVERTQGWFFRKRKTKSH